MNIVVILATGLLPLLVGYFWFNHALGFGKVWMSEAGLTVADLQRDFKPLKIFGLTYLLGIMAAMLLPSLVIHQTGLQSMLLGTPFQDKTSEAGKAYTYLMEHFGSNYRTFKHGVLHGVLTGLFLGLPIVGINALFERRGWKYIGIIVGYWMVTLGGMGGILCATLKM